MARFQANNGTRPQLGGRRRSARRIWRLALEALVGAAAFIASVVGGLERWGDMDPVFAGVLLGFASALLWGTGSFLAVSLPQSPRWTGYANLAAACFAAGASTYVTPCEKLILLRPILCWLWP